MSNSSAQIKTLSHAIADIHIPAAVESESRAIGDILRPLLLEMRRSRMTGEPMRQEVLDRFCDKTEAPR